MTSLLTADNYSKGFLVDDYWMAGVTQDPENAQSFVAFILEHTTGQYVGYHPFPSLDLALQAVNRIQRAWSFERLGGCGGNCKTGEGCAGGACKSSKSGRCSVGGC